MRADETTTAFVLLGIFLSWARSTAVPAAAPATPALPPSQMRQLRSETSAGCGPPFACLEVAMAPTPAAESGEALIRVAASSVNPSDVVLVEGQYVRSARFWKDILKHSGEKRERSRAQKSREQKRALLCPRYNFSCVAGCGADVFGTVVACPGCARLRAGDRVWTFALPGNPAWGEFIAVPEPLVATAPQGISAADAGSLPEVRPRCFASCVVVCVCSASGRSASSWSVFSR